MCLRIQGPTCSKCTKIWLLPINLPLPRGGGGGSGGNWCSCKSELGESKKYHFVLSPCSFFKLGGTGNRINLLPWATATKQYKDSRVLTVTVSQDSTKSQVDKPARNAPTSIASLKVIMQFVAGSL